MIELDKSHARLAAVARRKAAFGAVDGLRFQASAAAHLSALLAAHPDSTLAGYMPMRSEIDPMAAMAAHPGPVGVPVIIAKGQPLRFRQWTPGAALIQGAFGAMIPASGDWVTPQLLIVPLLAFDAKGWRLGYGGGFYDRTLQALRAAGPTFAIGFAFAAQEIDAVPVEATDQRLDMVVTEDGARSFC